MTEIQVPEYIPESERWAFSQLSPESQKVLLVHYQKSVANVMNDPKTWQNQVTENTEETLTFWLTLAEKQSIELDIHAGKPIMATPAYIKFLAALLPNGLRVEDEKGLIFFSSDTPEYEINNRSIEYEFNNGSIRANHAGAVAIIVEWLSELFGKPVRLPTGTEVQARIAEHYNFIGFRHSGGSVSSTFMDFVGWGWVDGVTTTQDGEEAPCAYQRVTAGFRSDAIHSSTSNSLSRESCDYGLSLFPFFG